MRIGSRDWMGRGRAEGVVHRVETALMGEALAIEQAPDQPGRLVEPVQALAEAGAEVDPEGVVLALEPATSETQHRTAVREVVEGRRELGGQPWDAERVGRHEQAEPDSMRQHRRGRPA